MAGVAKGSKAVFEEDFDPDVTEMDEALFDLDTETGKMTEEGEEPEDEEEGQSLEEEMANYSKRAKTRIKQLEAEVEAAKTGRQDEMARVARIAQEAIEENQRLRTGASDQYKKSLESEKKRIEAELEKAQEVVADAYDEGDGKALAKANATIGRLTAEMVKLDAMMEQAEKVSEKAQPKDAKAHVEPKKVDPKAVSWGAKNEWFGDPTKNPKADANMTYYALLYANDLEQRHGLDPTSDEYYSRIDKEIRTRFPEKFKGRAGAKSVVAPVSRTSGKKPKSIQISAQTVKFLQKNNIDPKEYAKEYFRVHGTQDDE